jgi:hypothetical protein
MSNLHLGSILQSAARNVLIFMKDAADHLSGKTSLSLTITASKDGGAFAAITPTVTERGNGWYNLALTTDHTDTLGTLALHVTGAGADPTDITYLVEGARPSAVEIADEACNSAARTLTLNKIVVAPTNGIGISVESPDDTAVRFVGGGGSGLSLESATNDGALALSGTTLIKDPVNARDVLREQLRQIENRLKYLWAANIIGIEGTVTDMSVVWEAGHTPDPGWALNVWAGDFIFHADASFISIVDQDLHPDPYPGDPPVLLGTLTAGGFVQGEYGVGVPARGKGRPLFLQRVGTGEICADVTITSDGWAAPRALPLCGQCCACYLNDGTPLCHGEMMISDGGSKTLGANWKAATEAAADAAAVRAIAEDMTIDRATPQPIGNAFHPDALRNLALAPARLDELVLPGDPDARIVDVLSAAATKVPDGMISVGGWPPATTSATFDQAIPEDAGIDIYEVDPSTSLLSALGKVYNDGWTADAGWIAPATTGRLLLISVYAGAGKVFPAGLLTILVANCALGGSHTIVARVPQFDGAGGMIEARFFLRDDGALLDWRTGGTIDPISVSAVEVGATPAEIDALLSAQHGAGAWGDSNGANAFDEMVEAHVNPGTFGERLAATARETSLFSQLQAGVVQTLVTRDANNAITIYRGDCKRIIFNLGSGWDLTGKKAYFCAKKSKAAANNTAIINRTCTITDAAAGICEITTTAAETVNADTYAYDLEVRNEDESGPVTAEIGTLNILEDVRK